ncbi:MAG: divergent polysaccharide deacetylase family protein, partial [Gemmatimonadaceae bacterium]|nr:divergent polysaccharide deacetylase family protein [Caulobacter sp.]
MAVSFSRKPAFSHAGPALGRGDSPDLRTKLLAAAANPYIGASGAALLFLLSLIALILLSGAPHKGPPLFR